MRYFCSSLVRGFHVRNSSFQVLAGSTAPVRYSYSILVELVLDVRVPLAIHVGPGGTLFLVGEGAFLARARELWSIETTKMGGEDVEIFVERRLWATAVAKTATLDQDFHLGDLLFVGYVWRTLLEATPRTLGAGMRSRMSIGGSPVLGG